MRMPLIIDVLSVRQLHLPSGGLTLSYLAECRLHVNTSLTLLASSSSAVVLLVWVISLLVLQF